MMVSCLVVFLMILGFSCGTQPIEGRDEVNSLASYVKKVQPFLDEEDNGVSVQCNNHMKEYINGLKKANRLWALKMFDATSKIPAGIGDGNFVDLGFFDECLEVEGISSTLPIENIFGKYCIGTLPLPKLTNTSRNQIPIGFDTDIFQPTARVATPDQTVGLQFGICIPKACSAEELTQMYAGIGLKMKFFDQLCQTKSDQPKLDSGGKATLWFLGVIFLIMLFCSVYDGVLLYLKKDQEHPILTAFSIITNGKKILRTSTSPNQISCLHGIRVISTMWVILGHRYVMQATFPVRNYKYLGEWMNHRANLFIINAPLSVDTFFLMSGLVVSYIYLSTVAKGIKFNIIMFYVHRYVRLTPVLAVIILIHTTLIKFFGSGPLYPSVQSQLIDGCERYWWKTLLYIQNYGSQSSFCVPQSWYLAVDTQLFLLSPIILIPLKRWPLPALLMTGVLTVCSMLASFLTGWFMELNTNIVGNGGETISDYMKWYYFATYTRAGPWLIGIVLGYYIFQIKQAKVRLAVNKGLIFIVWAVSLAVLCTCLFTSQDLIFGEYDKVANSIHLALVRPVWAIGLSWIIFACVTGYGGPINWFLSLPVFQILSKFTYTLYLLHLQLIIIVTAQIRTPPIFSNGKMMYAFWGDFAYTLVLAVVFTLAFESPIIIIEQTVFGKELKKQINSSEPGGIKRIEKSEEIA